MRETRLFPFQTCSVSGTFMGYPNRNGYQAFGFIASELREKIRT